MRIHTLRREQRLSGAPDAGQAEQIDGRYALWHHTHTFEPDGEETVMHDVVHYRIGCDRYERAAPAA